MAKRLVKKARIKFVNIFKILIVLTVIAVATYFILNIPIKNIIIKNTNYLNDDYILELADIKQYPNYFKYSNQKIVKSLITSKYIKSAKVKRKFFNVLEITIKENKPLFYRDSDRKIVFNNKESISQDENNFIFRVPRLLNYVPNNIYDEFLKGMDSIHDDTLSRISDISYNPNDIDKERFLLYMDDGNMVYLTLTKFKAINYYNTVLEQLENRKGILYLDNGNHFQIRE